MKKPIPSNKLTLTRIQFIAELVLVSQCPPEDFHIAMEMISEMAKTDLKTPSAPELAEKTHSLPS